VKEVYIFNAFINLEPAIYNVFITFSRHAGLSHVTYKFAGSIKPRRYYFSRLGRTCRLSHISIPLPYL